MPTIPISAGYFGPPPPPPPPPSYSSFTNILLAGGDSGSPSFGLAFTGYIVIRWMENEPTLVVTESYFQHYSASPIRPTGALLAALAAAGPGHQVVGFSAVAIVPPGELGILFDTGVSPRAWYTADLWNPNGATWSPATGLAASDGRDMAGTDPLADEVVVALANARTYTAPDGITYADNGAEAEAFNDLFWEIGQRGVYLAGGPSGIYKTIDSGATWGTVRPHAGEGTTWPAGANARQVYMLGLAPPAPQADLLVIGTANYQRLVAGPVWENGAATVDANSGQLRSATGGRMIHRTDPSGGTQSNRVSTDEGASWTTLAKPAGMDAANGHDWGPAGRLVLMYRDVTPSPDQARIYLSLDNGSSQNPISTAWNVNDPGVIACHPLNANRILGTYESTGNALFIHVTIDGGGAWADRQVDAGAFTAQPHSAYWLPSGRIVVGYELDSGATKIAYSDDLGVSWTVAFNETAHLKSFIRAGSYGPFFVALDRDSGLAADLILRSADGSSWEELASPVADTTPITGLEHDVSTDRLFVLWSSTKRIDLVTSASTRTAALWLTGFETLAVPNGTLSPSGSTLALIR